MFSFVHWCRCKQPLPVHQLGCAGICGSVQWTRLGNGFRLRIHEGFFVCSSYLGSVQQKSSFFTWISSLTCVPSWYDEQLLWQRLQSFYQQQRSWSYTLGSAFLIAKKAFDCGACPCFIACKDGKGDRFVSKISQWVRSQSVSFLSSLRLQLLLSRVKKFSAKISPAIIIILILFITILGMLLSCWGTGRKCNHKYF